VQPFTFSRVLVLAAFLIAGVLAVVILLNTSTLSVLTALGWLAVILCVYLASLLVP
jgi:hypothetical protein